VSWLKSVTVSPRDGVAALPRDPVGWAVSAGMSVPISDWVVGTMLTRQRARTSSPRS